MQRRETIPETHVQKAIATADGSTNMLKRAIVGAVIFMMRDRKRKGFWCLQAALRYSRATWTAGHAKRDKAREKNTGKTQQGQK
jgi:hypothetical protein